MTTPSTSSSCECGGEVDEACVRCGEQLHSDSAGRVAGCDNQHHEFKPVSPSQSVEEARKAVIEHFTVGHGVAHTHFLPSLECAPLDALIEAVRREQDARIENLQEIITRAGITSRETLKAAESEENKGG